jgi:hypothetical protein
MYFFKPIILLKTKKKKKKSKINLLVQVGGQLFPFLNS